MPAKLPIFSKLFESRLTFFAKSIQNFFKILEYILLKHSLYFTKTTANLFLVFSKNFPI